MDERPQQVDTFEIVLSQAQKVREALQDTHPEAKGHMDALLGFMEPYSYKPSNKVYLPEDVGAELAWFTRAEAARLATLKIAGADQLFGFAKALVQGCGFVVSDGKLVRFVGYAPKGTISAGTVLFDATADIDGVAHIVPYQTATEVPQATYENLEIIYVPQHTGKRLSRYFKSGANQRAYVCAMVKTIEAHMATGQRGLVVCKKTLIDQEQVPNWPDRNDPRFRDTASYTERYEWNIGGRKLCAVHWGTGIGSNAWKDAKILFLFDEFHLPRRVAVSHVQGLRGHRVHEGALPSMKTINSKSPAVDIYAMGHRLRWLKQMALRGCARCYNDNGACGTMRLVISCELDSFIANVGRLFPGAKVRITSAGEHGTWAEKIIEILNGTSAVILTTGELGELLGKPWRSVSGDTLTPEFRSALDGLGWNYVARKGRGGARFERKAASGALAA